MPRVEAPFKIAIRTEGRLVNAYLSPRVMAEGKSILMASLNLSMAQQPEVFALFKQMLIKWTDIQCGKLGMTGAVFTEASAPESERTKE